MVQLLIYLNGQVDEGMWQARVLVHDTHRLEQRTYAITMLQVGLDEELHGV